MIQKARGRPPKKKLKAIWMKQTVATRIEKFSKYSEWPQGVVIDRALTLLEKQHDV